MNLDDDLMVLDALGRTRLVGKLILFSTWNRTRVSESIIITRYGIGETRTNVVKTGQALWGLGCWDATRCQAKFGDYRGEKVVDGYEGKEFFGERMGWTAWVSLALGAAEAKRGWRLLCRKHVDRVRLIQETWVVGIYFTCNVGEGVVISIYGG
jgi:hypothetical protein